MGLDTVTNDIYQKNDATSTKVITPIKNIEVDLSDVKTHADYKLKFHDEFNLSEKEQIAYGIRQTVEKTGLSKDYLENILLEEEKLRLNVYDDGVKYHENDKHGTYTVGYGHAKTILGKYIDSPLYKPDVKYYITENNKDLITLSVKDAFELLQEDIEDAKLQAQEFFGESFNEAPKSIQEAIIDIIFNKGIDAPFIEKTDSPTYLLKKDLEKKDYLSAALHTVYKTQNAGLKKRNMFRFLHAIKDLPKNEQRKAIKKFEPEKIKTSQAYKNKGFVGYIKNLYFLMCWNYAKGKLDL